MKAEAAMEPTPPEEPTCWDSTSHDGTCWRGPSETRQAPSQSMHGETGPLTASHSLQPQACMQDGLQCKTLARAEDLSCDDAVWDGG